MSSNHDELLSRILPRVDNTVLGAAQKAIGETTFDSRDLGSPVGGISSRPTTLRTKSNMSQSTKEHRRPEMRPRCDSYDNEDVDHMPTEAVKSSPNSRGKPHRSISSADRQDFAVRPANTRAKSNQTHPTMAGQRTRVDAFGDEESNAKTKPNASRAPAVIAPERASSTQNQRSTLEAEELVRKIKEWVDRPVRPAEGRKRSHSDPSSVVHREVERPAQESSKRSNDTIETVKPWPGTANGKTQSRTNGHANGDGQMKRANKPKELMQDDYQTTDTEDEAPPVNTRSRRATDSSARSATPPPITQKNRNLRYENIDEEEETDYTDVRNLAVRSPFEGQRRSPEGEVTRSLQREAAMARQQSMQSQISAPNNIQRVSALAASYNDLRVPTLNQSKLYRDQPQPDDDFRGFSSHSYEGRAPSTRRSYRILDEGQYNDFMKTHPDGRMDDEWEGANGSRSVYSDNTRPVFSRQQTSSKQTAATSVNINANNTSSMPDFFGQGIFDLVLHNPATAFRLRKFASDRLCGENVDFLAKTDEYRNTLNNLTTAMAAIHTEFIAPGATHQINVASNLLRTVHTDMKTLINNAFPAMDTLFSDVQESIEHTVYADIYPRFVRYQLALSASRALGDDRFKYQGLGDCFAITNPHMADNPIVCASDGFVKVTGYSRNEIIPRNCRFLQGPHTDRSSVKRLKRAIDTNKESVELLLNYTKDGKPFWNLLYCAPLFDSRGRVQFFIGGQVNCSTTIHSNSDVLKVLSVSSTPEADEAAKGIQRRVPAKSSTKTAFLKAFGFHSRDDIQDSNELGMETAVLGKMEGQDLTSQMEEFYTAYSKYMVINPRTWVIEFYSAGIPEMLHPANVRGMIAGNDVFKFLRQSMLTNQTEYKHKVRSAIRGGLPASTQLRLQTKRSASFRGDEVFNSHWTPCKDEHGRVTWVVCTMAPIAQR